MSFQYPEQVQPEPQRESGGGIDPIWLVAGMMLIIALIGIIALLFVISQRKPVEAAPAAPVNYDIPTAREAYPAAVNLIRSQDVGALLMTAEGAWTPNIDMTQLISGRTGWTFFFYLPRTEEMAAVITDTKSGARIASVKAWPTPPKVQDERSWVADSSIGMDLFLEKCGGEVRGDRQVVARMSTASEFGTLVWQREVVTPDNSVVCSAETDARTGQPR